MIHIGQKLTYFPKPLNADDRRHFPAVVERMGKRVTVRIFMEGHPEGVLRSVGYRRLIEHPDLLEESCDTPN